MFSWNYLPKQQTDQGKAARQRNGVQYLTYCRDEHPHHYRCQHRFGLDRSAS